MASPARTQAIYEEQRQQQVALRAAFLKDFVQAYDVLDWQRLDESANPWVQAAMSVIKPYRQQSAELAEQAYASARRELIPASKAQIPAPTITYTNSRNSGTRAPGGLGVVDWADFDRAAERSLLVTGPGELKKQARLHRPEREAKALGLAKASGAGSRHVLNGGREVIMSSVVADDAALGWMRVTDGDPCEFCALMSSRGPVYKTEQSASFKPHDLCACVPVAVFGFNAPWPGRGREFRKLYDDNIKGKYSGKEAIAAWRKLYRQQTAKPRQLEVA